MQLNRKHRQKQKTKKNKKQNRNYYRQNRRRTVVELEILKTIIEKTLGRTVDPLTEKTTFVDDLGMDSLDFFQMLIDLEETYDIHIDAEDAEEIVTISDAVETLRRATKGKRNGK